MAITGVIGSPGGGAAFDGRFISAIFSAGAGNALETAWDAADINSYPGGGATTIFDVSGNGNHFRRGNGANSNSIPSFQGVAGNLSANEHFLFENANGPDCIGLLAASNPAAFNLFHRDNGAFGVLTAFYFDGVTSQRACQFSTTTRTGSGTDFGQGVIFDVTGGIGGVPANSQLEVVVSRASANTALYKGSAVFALNRPGWNIVGLSLNEAGGSNGAFFYANGGYVLVAGGASTWDGTYSSPASGNAKYRARFGAYGLNTTNGSVFDGSAPNSRWGFGGVWSRAPAKAEFDAIYALMGPRYGLF